MSTKMYLRDAVTCGGLLVLAWGLAAPVLASLFDVVGSGLTAGPPYPSTPPILVHVTDDNVPVRRASIEDIALTFSDGIDEIPMSAMLSDSGGGEGLPGTAMQYQPILEVSGVEPPPTMHIESFFDVFAPPGLTAVGIPGPVADADSFFDVFFDVQFSDGWTMKHHLHGEIPLGQDVAFTDASGVMAETLANMVHCRQIHTIKVGPNAAASLPLMTVTLTGSFVPEPATIVLLVLGGLVCPGSRRRS
jgi:hypothetical protein